MKRIAYFCLLSSLVTCTSSSSPKADSEVYAPSRGSPTLAPKLAAAIERAQSGVQPARIADSLKVLTGKPHHAGSAADQANANYVHQRFLSAGWQSRIDTYEVLIPYPIETVVELLAPVAYRAPLIETPLDIDFDTHTQTALPPYLAYSPDGEATGVLVYVNRATTEDFEALARMGIPLRGAIGIARYGGLFRGNKVKNAAAAGLSALILYSDPKDDGFVRGDVYPKGPWRPGTAVQRGSILDVGLWPGDPLTPGEPAITGTPRLDVDVVPVFPKIPAAVLSSEEARPFLEALDGPGVPESWQGGHPFTYHVGGGKARAHVRTLSDWRLRPIANVIATLPGTLDPESTILVGSHRDAWVQGAVDPSSGTAILLEMATVLGALARDGEKPTRSITLCSFGAEEFGIIGSVEHVERYERELADRAALYLNCDAAVSGGKLEAHAPPELRTLLQSALSRTDDERAPGSTLLDTSAPGEFQLLGGGSDHVGFLHRLAIPCLSITTSGPYGVYHSRYDTFGWMKRHGDPGFAHHTRLSRLLLAVVQEAALQTVLPYDFEALANWITATLEAPLSGVATPERESLRAAEVAFATSARTLSQALSALVESDPDPAKLVALNRALRGSFRHFLQAGMLPSRPFYKHLLVGVDADSGYEAEYVPALRAALASGKEAQIAGALSSLVSALSRCQQSLDSCTALAASLSAR